MNAQQMPDPSLPWPIPMEGVLLIADSEQGQTGGAALSAYRCPAGVWTIGWGETDGVKPGDKCTKAQADAMLSRDLAHRVEAVRAMCTREPGPNELAALVSLAYNIGLRDDKRRTGLYYSTVLKCHNAGDTESAARAFNLFNKARVNGALVELAGLTKRRHREAALYLEDASGTSTAGTMPQDVAPQSSLAASPIAQTGAAAGTMAVLDAMSKSGDQIGTVGATVKQAKSLAVETLGIPADWFLPVLLAVIAGVVIWQRLKQRSGGWA